MAIIPLGKESAIMQVVVRLRSIQSLQKIIKGVGGKEDTTVDEPEEKKLEEYIVLQKMMLEGYEEPWMVWGTTQETKIEDVLGEKTAAESPAVAKP